MTLIEALKLRTATTESRLAARFRPVRITFPKGMKPAEIAQAHAVLRQIEAIAKPPAPGAG
jgi:hypothetical protein